MHGDKYDYSLVVYVNNDAKVTIVCPEHGPFKQTPNIHLRDSGCSRCVKCFDSRRSNTDEFIVKARSVHGDKYDYSLVEYTRVNQKVTITCQTHGLFDQT